MHADRDTFIAEVERRLLRIFSNAKNGLKADLADKHRCEGFIQGGVFMGLVTQEEMSQLMEHTHRRVFGQGIAERQAELACRRVWQPAAVDYSRYETPAVERRRR